MFSQIKNYIKSCDKCCRIKNPKKAFRAQLLSIPIEGPFEIVAMDVLGPFVPSIPKGNKFILIFSCLFTRFVEASAIPNQTATTCAKKLLSKIVYRHGCPRKLLSDRGTNFRSEMMNEMARLLDIEQRFTSPYHPQTDGCVERFNKTFAKMMSPYVDGNQKNWDAHLKPLLMAYRTSIHASTQYTPFFLTYGREARLPVHCALLPPNEKSASIKFHIEKTISNIKEAEEKAKAHMQKMQQKNTEIYNKKINENIYEIGDKCWLYNPAVKIGTSKKLTGRWHGPYTVIEQTGPVNYKLSIENKRIPFIVHHNRLKKFTDRKEIPTEHIKLPESAQVFEEKWLPAEDKPPQLKPMIDTTDTAQDPENVFQAEKIVRERTKDGKKQYRVRWWGYKSSDDTWESEENIIDKRLIENFNNKKGNIKLNLIPNFLHPLVEPLHLNYRQLAYKFATVAIFTYTLFSLFARAHTVDSDAIIDHVIDCSQVKHAKVVQINDRADCNKAIHKNVGEVETFEGQVKEYSMSTTKFPIFLCELKKVEMICDENFLTSKEKSKSVKQIAVSKKECLTALSNKNTKYGKLDKISPGHWSTKSNDHYNCVWMENNKAQFYHFKISQYFGYLRGESHSIHQVITKSNCDYDKYECIPKEEPHKIIIWKKIQHNFHKFRTLGNFTIQRLDSFFLVPELSIGGAAQFESPTEVQLDNGYIIVKNSSVHNDIKQLIRHHSALNQDSSKISNEIDQTEFNEKSAQFHKNLRVDLHSAILAGHITSLIGLIRANFKSLWSMTCNQRLQEYKVQNWILKHFPHMSTNLISQRQDILIKSIGDAFLVSNCKVIRHFQIYFNRSTEYQSVHHSRKSHTDGPKCYKDFPIHIKGANKIRFLRLEDRNIVQKSQQISCKNRPNFTMMKSKNGSFVHISANGSLSWQPTPKTKFSVVFEVAPPKGLTFIITYKHSEIITHFSMLLLISTAQEALEDLAEIHRFGNQSVVAGICKAIGGTLRSIAHAGGDFINDIGGTVSSLLSTVADGGNKIILSTFSGTAKVLDSSGNVVKDVGKGASYIIKSVFGSFSILIIWIHLLLLTAYVLLTQGKFKFIRFGKKNSIPKNPIIKNIEYSKCRRCSKDIIQKSPLVNKAASRTDDSN